MGAAAIFRDDLLDRCIAGEEGAWHELHHQHRPRALAFLRRLGVRPRELEDACQEVFLQIFRYLDRFERRADFRTWLYKLCISQAARLRRRAALLRPLSWLRGESGAVFPEWSAFRAAEVAEQALASLSARQRTVFVLFELEGLPTAEIARLLECPGPTVRRLLQEARQRFERQVLDAPGEGR